MNAGKGRNKKNSRKYGEVREITFLLVTLAFVISRVDCTYLLGNRNIELIPELLSSTNAEWVRSAVFAVSDFRSFREHNRTEICKKLALRNRAAL